MENRRGCSATLSQVFSVIRMFMHLFFLQTCCVPLSPVITKHKVRDKTCLNYYIAAPFFYILVNVFSLFASPFGLQFSIIATKALCKAEQEGHSWLDDGVTDPCESFRGVGHL